LLHLSFFLHATVPGDICESGFTTVRTFVSFRLGHTLWLPHLSTTLVHPLMGCDWLLFLIICQLPYMSLSESGSCTNSKKSLLPLVLNFKPYLLKGLWKLVTGVTQIGTCWSRQRNDFHFIKPTVFRRIRDEQNSCLLNTLCNQKRVVKSDPPKIARKGMYRRCKNCLTHYKQNKIISYKQWRQE
jgi:hypothetical protein